jgi:hypothetical protein
MMLTDRALWLLELAEDLLARSPIVVTTRERCSRRERNAFDLGRDAMRIYLQDPQPPPPPGKRHLTAV